MTEDQVKKDKNGFLTQLRNGILDNNPTLVQLLGMCPTLAVTTSVKNAIGMGLAATAVLICSNVFISALRKFIPSQVRIAAFIVIISGFVTAVELLMKAFFYELYGALGLFIPLIVVNCIILARAEAFASKNKVLPSAIDGLSMGLGFTFALIIIATIREILGAGTFLGFPILGSHYNPAILFILPPGAFLTLGFVIAAVQKIRNTKEDKARLARLSCVGGEEPTDKFSSDLKDIKEDVEHGENEKTELVDPLDTANDKKEEEKA